MPLAGGMTPVVSAVTRSSSCTNVACASASAARAQGSDGDKPGADTASQHDHATDDVAPPVRVRDVEAVYPTTELRSGKDVLVTLAVTVAAVMLAVGAGGVSV